MLEKLFRFVQRIQQWAASYRHRQTEAALRKHRDELLAYWGVEDEAQLQAVLAPKTEPVVEETIEILKAA